MDYCGINLGCDLIQKDQTWSDQLWTTAFKESTGRMPGGEVNAELPVERLPYHDKECCVMAWATPDFYYCNSGREEPLTGEDELDDWQDEWRAATVCTLSLRLFIPSPDARRPLCLSPSPPIIRISVMTAKQRGLWAAPVRLTRVPLTLLCFTCCSRLNRTSAEHFIYGNLVCVAAPPAAHWSQPQRACACCHFSASTASCSWLNGTA